MIQFPHAEAKQNFKLKFIVLCIVDIIGIQLDQSHKIICALPVYYFLLSHHPIIAESARLGVASPCLPVFQVTISSFFARVIPT